VAEVFSCASREAAAESLAAVLGAPASEVVAAIEAIRRADLEAAGDDPWRALATVVRQTLGVRELRRLQLTRFFHGVRTVDPTRYRRDGLLPLDQALEAMWGDLRHVGGDLLDDAQFAELRRRVELGEPGHNATLYRDKTGHPMHFGPWAVLVREDLMRTAELSNHEYLRVPEIVEDIAISAQELFDVPLLAAYEAAARPCIVVFDMPDERWETSVLSACWYVRERLDGGLSHHTTSGGGFCGHGDAVPPSAIVDVELLTDDDLVRRL
jgi:hypothetical protein